MGLQKLCPEVSNYARFSIWGIKNAHLATMFPNALLMHFIKIFSNAQAAWTSAAGGRPSFGRLPPGPVTPAPATAAATATAGGAAAGHGNGPHRTHLFF